MSFKHEDIHLLGEKFTRRFKDGMVRQNSVMYDDGSSKELSNTDDINIGWSILKDQR